MTKPGMLSFFTRSRAALLFLEVLFLWSLLPLQTANGNPDLSRLEQREYFAQGQACQLPLVADPRGKQSIDQQSHAFTRTHPDSLEAFEHTATAERASAVRAITPLPVLVIKTQQTSSDL